MNKQREWAQKKNEQIADLQKRVAALEKRLNSRGGQPAKCTVAEARAYAKERGMPASDGEAFFDSLEANGWKRGPNLVKDWKAHFRVTQRYGRLASQQVTRPQDREFGFHKPNSKPKPAPEPEEPYDPASQEEIDEAMAAMKSAVGSVMERSKE